MRKLMCSLVFLAVTLWSNTASAYLMSQETYSNMFERAEVVVIATPITTQDSQTALMLEVEQPERVTDLIKTVDTEFRIAYMLKGELDDNTFHFLHLNLKGKRDKHSRPTMFGETGTFFVDFDSERNKKMSFILFMTRQKDGTYCPAWRPMEGSRAIIAVEKDGEL